MAAAKSVAKSIAPPGVGVFVKLVVEFHRNHNHNMKEQ
jgi:hypothetical protein